MPGRAHVPNVGVTSDHHDEGLKRTDKPTTYKFGPVQVFMIPLQLVHGEFIPNRK